MAERKFAALAELRRRPDPEPTEKPAAPDQAPEPPPIETGAPAPELDSPTPAAVEPAPPPAAASVPVLAAPPVITSEAQRGRGRPPGKRSDPDWAPRTILMRSKTHRRVSIMLIERDDSPDLSELVDQLLTDWISRQA